MNNCSGGVNTICKKLYHYKLLFFLKKFSQTTSVSGGFWSSWYFRLEIVNIFNVNFRNEAMNFILLFYWCDWWDIDTNTAVLYKLYEQKLILTGYTKYLMTKDNCFPETYSEQVQHLWWSTSAKTESFYGHSH